MIQVALEWAQVMAGTTTPILEDNKVLPHLTEQWLAGVQEFLVENNSSIHIPSLRKQQVCRTNDQRIMDIVMKQQCWTDRQIRNINNYRLYLRVENISDMANNQGDRILQPILKGIRCGSTSTMHWPIQARPSSGKGAWTDWRAFLKSICRHTNILRKPLGHWTNTNSWTWAEYIDPTTNKVYIQRNGLWTQYKIIKKNRRTWNLQEETSLVTVDTTNFTPCEFIESAMAIRTPIRARPTPIEHRGSSASSTSTASNTSNNTKWHEFVAQLPAWEQELLCHSEECDDTDTTFEYQMQ
jgi:hypothetical protein